MVLSVPDGVLLTVPNSTVSVESYDTGDTYPNYTYTTYSDGSISTLTVYDFCNDTSGCIVGSSFSIMLNWIKNPTS